MSQTNYAGASAHPVTSRPDPESGGAKVDLEAYCTRIGFDGALSPTIETLRELIVRHVGAIPFEAIDVLLDRGIDLAPAAVDEKLISARRGGYCFEQNGLFQRVLIAIGFEVESLLARVRWMQPAEAPPTPRTHMVLRVTANGEPWLADVGFGASVPTAPLRMTTTEEQPTGNEVYRMRSSAGGTRLEMRTQEGWMPLYEIDPEPQFDIDFELANWFTATHPSSHFRHRLIVTRSLPGVRYALLENRFTVRGPEGETERQVLSADQIEQTLEQIFGLAVEPEWRPIIEKAAAAQPDLSSANSGSGAGSGNRTRITSLEG